MSYIKTKGVVLKEINTGEADKIIVLLTESHGSISVSANGSRRIKSALAACTQFLCYGEYMLFKGKNYFTLSSCNIIEPFYEIRKDLVKLTFATHMSDILMDVAQEGQQCKEGLQLFLKCVYMLAKKNRDPRLITVIFELRLVSELGYKPQAIGCTNCGSTAFSDMYFSFAECGFICSQCLTAGKPDICSGNLSDNTVVRLSTGAAKALFFIVNAKIDHVFGFGASESVIEELMNVSARYTRERLGKEYKKLEFLKKFF